MQDDEWLSVSAAARRLGVSRQSLQNRIKRGTIECRRNNRGDPMVLVAAVSDATGVASWALKPKAVASDTVAVPPRQMLQEAVESTVERRHQAELERLQVAHGAELARVQTLHLDLVDRIQAQAATERQLFLERVDSAEIRAEAAEARAERVEQRLDQVLEVLLAERRQAIGAAPTDPVERRSWWRRLFGESRRSSLG